MGVTGVQLLPYDFLIDAVREAERKLGERIPMVASIVSGTDLEKLHGLEAPATLLHAEVTDSRDVERIGPQLDAIRETGSLAGLATHRPLSTLNWLMGAGLDIDAVMLPLNMVGRFMDSGPEEVVEAIRSLDKPVIVKKTLAAGALDPEEALTYLARLKCVHAVAVGVASEKEAEETLPVAVRLFGSRSGGKPVT